MSVLLVLTWLVPLAGAALAWSARFWWISATAAPPALATAALVPEQHRIEFPCGMVQPFVFSHPAVKVPLRLAMCIQGPVGPGFLDAPPRTNPLVTLVQLHLNALAYKAGSVDGLVGPQTRSAIRRFQEDQGANRTEDITFDRLGRIRSATASVSTADPAGREVP